MGTDRHLSEKVDDDTYTAVMNYVRSVARMGGQEISDDGAKAVADQIVEAVTDPMFIDSIANQARREELLQRIAHDAGAELITGYAGRFMDGAECIGFVTSWPTAAMNVLGQLAARFAVELAEVGIDMVNAETRTDSWAGDTIIYFPGIQISAPA